MLVTISKKAMQMTICTPTKIRKRSAQTSIFKKLYTRFEWFIVGSLKIRALQLLLIFASHQKCFFTINSKSEAWLFPTVVSTKSWCTVFFKITVMHHSFNFSTQKTSHDCSCKSLLSSQLVCLAFNCLDCSEGRVTTPHRDISPLSSPTTNIRTSYHTKDREC